MGVPHVAEIWQMEAGAVSPSLLAAFAHRTMIATEIVRISVVTNSDFAKD